MFLPPRPRRSLHRMGGAGIVERHAAQRVGAGRQVVGRPEAHRPPVAVDGCICGAWTACQASAPGSYQGRRSTGSREAGPHKRLPSLHPARDLIAVRRCVDRYLQRTGCRHQHGCWAFRHHRRHVGLLRGRGRLVVCPASGWPAWSPWPPAWRSAQVWASWLASPVAHRRNGRRWAVHSDVMIVQVVGLIRCQAHIEI